MGMKDFWEWDQATNTWTQKADFGGTGRVHAVGFSIGTKGYIGSGNENMNLPDLKKDFWEWDQATDTWSQKADFGGAARYGAVGFSIGNYGYIGTGYDNYGETKDFWEWDQATDTWTQKADFGGTERFHAVGFSIGDYGYIGTGYDNYGETKDFWEYDPSAVSVSEIENEKEFNIFPNPTSDNFIITIPSQTRIIQIYNSAGQLSQTKIPENEKSMNFKLDNSGIYFIQVITDKKILTKKLIVAN